jgi:hypothetical protein
MGRARSQTSAVANTCSRSKADGRVRTYKLLGPSGPYLSTTPGVLGGHRRQRVYGRLDCSSALRAITAGGPYPLLRVFFASEAEAIACGYRPCARCLPEAYRVWKLTQTTSA